MLFIISYVNCIPSRSNYIILSFNDLKNSYSYWLIVRYRFHFQLEKSDFMHLSINTVQAVFIVGCVIYDWHLIVSIIYFVALKIFLCLSTLQLEKRSVLYFNWIFIVKFMAIWVLYLVFSFQNTVTVFATFQ